MCIPVKYVGTSGGKLWHTAVQHREAIYFPPWKRAALCFVFVSAGYSRVNKPSVLHDSCNSRMFIRLHAASFHSTKLNRLCVGTSHGQRHGRTQEHQHSHQNTSQTLSSPLLTSSALFSQVKTGFVMNILGVLSVTLAMNTWGVAMFDLHSYPEWARPINKTALLTGVHFSSVQSVNATLWSLNLSMSTEERSEDCK